MSYESFVGLRYLMSKRRNSVVSIITLISVSGVALGVAAMIVVLSVMGGFKKDLKEKILGTKAHAIVRAVDDGVLKDYDALAERVAGVDGVVGASPFVQAEVMISSPTNLSGVVLRGIDVKRVTEVSELESSLTEGKLNYLVDAAPLMEELQKKRKRELDELLGRIKTEQQELEDLKRRIDAVEPAEPKAGDPRGEALPDLEVVDPVDGAALNPPPSTAGGGDFFMPAMDDESATLPDVAPNAEGGAPEPLPVMPAMDDSDAVMPGFDDPTATGEDGKPRVPGLLIGPELAKSLQVDVGSEVNVVTPNGEMGPSGPIPRSRPFRIVGKFYSGMYEYDANYAYTLIGDAQDFLSVPGATGIEVKTRDVEQAEIYAEGVRSVVGPGVEVLDWQQLNRSLFYALKLEKIAMFVVLAFIILVASFSIVAMLIMIVIEKGREIAILKSMGASNPGVMKTFVIQGAVIGAVGTAMGSVFGLVICYLLATVGFPLNSEVYYISTLPVDINWIEIVLIIICANVISVLATIYPSIQAARLEPVEGLRYE